jgi:hypothetical protein
MVTVEFRSVAPGTCSWCRKDKKEVFTVVFDDGSFNGPTALCMNDLRCAMRLKLVGCEEKSANRSSDATDNDA